MKKNTCLPYPIEGPYYDFLIQEDYQQDKSLIIFKLHHTLMDGVGVVTLISSLMDEFDRSAFLKYRSFSEF